MEKSNKTQLITKDLAKEIFDNAPAGVNHESLLNEMVARGYVFEGFNDVKPEPAPQPTMMESIKTKLTDIGNRQTETIQNSARLVKEGKQGILPAVGQTIGASIGAAGESFALPVNEAAKAALSFVGEYAPESIKKAATDLVQKGIELTKPNIEAYNALPEATKANVKAATDLLGGALNLSVGAGAVKGLGEVGVTAIKETPALLQTGKQTITTAFTPSEEKIKTGIVEAFNKGVKPLLSGKKNMGDLKTYEGKVVEAVNTIKNNKDVLQYTDELGDVISGQNPKSLQQFADAIDQTKTNIFKQYNELAQKAGGQGLKVDTRELSKELDSVINNKALSITNPSAIDYASELQARLKTLKNVDPDTAQEVIKNYNKQLESFYKNPTYDAASRVAIDALVANKFRSYLDDGISKLTGDSYQSLKNTYGALSTVEKDVVRAALRDARKNVKGLIDFGDILSGGQVASGILTMNPATIATGAVQKGIQEFIKYKNNPNRLIDSMFKKAEKLPQTVQSPKNSLLQIKPTATPINAQANITNIADTIPQSTKAATKVGENFAIVPPMPTPDENGNFEITPESFVLSMLGSVGLSKAKATKINRAFRAEDRRIMKDLIDYNAGGYKPDAKALKALETEASFLADKISSVSGLKLPKTVDGLSTMFAKFLNKIRQ